MDARRRWQIPVLVIGVLILLFVGAKAIMDMSGGPRVQAHAKEPEKRKTTAATPTPEATPGGGTAATAATPAGATGGPRVVASASDPEAEIVGVRLPAGDPLAPLPGTVSPGLLVSAPPTGGAPTGPTPPVPPVGPAGSPPGTGLVSGGPPVRIIPDSRGWLAGRGFPAATGPGERRPDTGVVLVGTITGAKQIAVVRDDSRPAGQQLVLATVGDRIGPRGSAIQQIEPGSIRVRGQMGATHVYSAEQAAGQGPAAGG